MKELEEFKAGDNRQRTRGLAGNSREEMRRLRRNLILEQLAKSVRWEVRKRAPHAGRDRNAG